MATNEGNSIRSTGIFAVIFVALFLAGFYIGRAFSPPPPRIAYAESTARCGNGSKVTASTGNTSGRCVVNTRGDGTATGVECNDGHGNSASGNCTDTGA